MLVIDSIEIDEAQYPILMEERRIATDTMGAGRWNGAPATEGAYRSLAGPVSVFYCSDGDLNPAQGVLGGSAGAPSLNRKRAADGAFRTPPPRSTRNAPRPARRSTTAPSPAVATATRASATPPRSPRTWRAVGSVSNARSPSTGWPWSAPPTASTSWWTRSKRASSAPTPEGCGDGATAAALSGRMRADRFSVREEVP